MGCALSASGHPRAFNESLVVGLSARVRRQAVCQVISDPGRRGLRQPVFPGSIDIIDHIAEFYFIQIGEGGHRLKVCMSVNGYPTLAAITDQTRHFRAAYPEVLRARERRNIESKAGAIFHVAVGTIDHIELVTLRIGIPAPN